MEIVKKDPSKLPAAMKKKWDVGSKTEAQVAKMLERQGLQDIEFNDDCRFDIKGVFGGETIYIEVKEDFTCKKTGNVGIEFSCHEKPSGIEKTKADLYAFKLHLPDGSIVLDLVKVSDLKQLIKKKKYKKVVTGGLKALKAMNYIFSLKVIEEVALRVHVFN